MKSPDYEGGPILFEYIYTMKFKGDAKINKFINIYWLCMYGGDAMLLQGLWMMKVVGVRTVKEDSARVRNGLCCKFLLISILFCRTQGRLCSFARIL